MIIFRNTLATFAIASEGMSDLFHKNVYLLPWSMKIILRPSCVGHKFFQRHR